MGYDRELYQQLQAEYELQQQRNAEELETRQREIFARVPELARTDYDLKMIGVRISKLILVGGKPDALSALRAEQKALRARRQRLLRENGYPEDALSVRYRCEKCRDTGTVGTRACTCYQKRLVALAYERSNLSSRLTDQDFAHFDASLYSDDPADGPGVSPRRNILDIVDVCRQFVETFDAPGKSLLFTGRPGVGKTFLSTCVAKELIGRGFGVIYETSYRIFSMLDEYKFKRGADDGELKTRIDRLYDCDLLIMDDLGAEFKTSYTSAALFDVVNTRLLENRKCILSTNLSLQELSNQYSERIVSRIAGGYTVLQFFGRDIRQRDVDA